MSKKYVFEAKAALVSTVVGGKSIEITKDGPSYSTTDAGEAEQLRAIDGLKEVSTYGKES